MRWRRTPNPACPGREPGPEQSFELNNLDLDVQAALEELPPDFRAAVVLCDLEGLSYDEVAEALGVKLGTVRSRIHRGRTMLREKLAHRDPRPAAVPQAAAQDAPHRRRSLIGAMRPLNRLLAGLRKSAASLPMAGRRGTRAPPSTSAGAPTAPPRSAGSASTLNDSGKRLSRQPAMN